MKLMFAFTVLAVVIHESLASVSPIDSGVWTKLNSYPVCFGAQGNSFGSLTNRVASGLVGALKLVHVSGRIRCARETKYNSRWGCHRYSTLLQYPLNTVITDGVNKVIFPQQEFVRPKNEGGGLWYWNPFVDESLSTELVFTDFARPFYLPYNGQLRVWYGEDLLDYYETNNSGVACVFVFARFI